MPAFLTFLFVVILFTFLCSIPALTATLRYDTAYTVLPFKSFGSVRFFWMEYFYLRMP